MEWEARRLASFEDFPTDQVSALQLAAAGFYATGSGDEVACFSCGGRHGNWKKGDNPRIIHQQLSPQCRFLRGQDVGTPLVPEHPFSQGASMLLLMEEFRTGSMFRLPPPPPLNSDLYLLERELDRHPLSLDASELLLEQSGGRPDQEPQQQRLGSARSRGEQPGPSSGPLQLMEIERGHQQQQQQRQQQQPLQQQQQAVAHSQTPSAAEMRHRLNIHVGRPRYPQFALPVRREESFAAWPHQSNQDSSRLCEAGFFYNGQGDGVRCFQCGGGLRNWQPEDQPWLEHARWFPACTFLRQCKGDNFVAAVQELSREGRDEMTLEEVEEKMRLNSGDEDKEGTAGTGQEQGRRSLEEETAELREEMRCKICMEREVSIVFLPCGHLVACPLCAPALARCPVCRQHVKASVKAYVS